MLCNHRRRNVVTMRGHKENRRTELIKFRVNEGELLAVQKSAARAQLTVSAYLRQLISDDRARRQGLRDKGFLQRHLAGGGR